MYEYKAHVTKVYDGDTITCDIDLGLYTWLKNQKIRLLGIDTPELYGGTEEQNLAGRRAKEALMALILGSDVILRTTQDKREKYGRWLAQVTVEEEGVLIDVNLWMLAHGHAVVMAYP